MADSLDELQKALRRFADEREWGQFHSPKNLSAALAVEAGELLEHFQWLTEQQSRDLPPAERDAVAAEAADVLLYLIQFCAALDIDLLKAAATKLARNAEKYPVDRARGSSKKYDQI
jgi:NTP pyrophosphatase (non-canonical NTP hydrolase)